MIPSFARRRFAMGLAAGLVGSVAGPCVVRAASREADQFRHEMTEIERDSRGRLGVAVVNTSTGQHHGHREDERFPMCSTFKVLASGAVLTRVDAGLETLDRRVRFGAGDLVPYSPVTKDRVGGDGMTLAELCEAAITRSDNTAGNLLLASLGGPSGVTEFARSLGDPVTRLDRTETSLNEAIPGDPRDTTTPKAMAADLARLTLGDKLSNPSREQLTRWLVANTTGGTRLRAGVGNWRVGDKTGAGERGTTNDIAVMWPPGREPFVVTVYLTETTASVEACNATIAAVGRVVARMGVG